MYLSVGIDACVSRRPAGGGHREQAQARDFHSVPQQKVYRLVRALRLRVEGLVMLLVVCASQQDLSV